MSLRRMIMWQPQGAQRLAVLAACLGALLLLGQGHKLYGLAYEFHLFFSVPVIAASWLLGMRGGIAVAATTVALWFYIDMRLGAVPSVLLFNTAMRLLIALGGAWLLVHLRRVLDRESRLAREDTLTGLANRRAFYEHGRAALALSRRQETPFTAVFIDLDRFKQVNDELGHEAGDALLRRVADTFRAHVRTGDIAGRLGGDEFALLLPGMDGDAARSYVEDLRRRLLDAMRAHDWPVTFSIGVACHHRAPVDLDKLLTCADGLMYEVKEGGRDRILLRTFEAETA